MVVVTFPTAVPAVVAVMRRRWVVRLGLSRVGGCLLRRLHSVGSLRSEEKRRHRRQQEKP